MAILSKTGFYGAIESVKATGEKIKNRLGAIVPKFASTFVSGFAGNGFAIRNTAEDSGGENWEAEFDTLTIRKTFKVFELLIARIRAVNGGLVISHANGKVKAVNIRTNNALMKLCEITLDDVCEFVVGDLVRMQVFREGNQRYFHMRVTKIEDRANDEGKTETWLTLVTNGSYNMDFPRVGDEIVQFGSSDKDRQSAIYLHNDGGAQIDLLEGINSFDTTNNVGGWVKCRIGADLPDTDQESGFYCRNGKIFAKDSNGNTMYSLNPNGSGQLANEAIKWDENGNMTFGNGVTLGWDNLTAETQSRLQPSIEYSADNVNWHPEYESGDQWMRIGYGDSESTMKLDQSGDNAYLHIRYGYYEYVTIMGQDANRFVMLPADASSTEMAKATHIGTCASTSPTAPTNESGYKWVEFKGADGKDANLLPWVEEWNGNTMLGSDKIISPRIFTGTSTDNVLSGIALGRSVIGYTIASDGKLQYSADPRDLKSGIVGISNNEITFAIREDGTAYFNGDIYSENAHIRGEVNATSGSFTGTVTSTNGDIGGFHITPDGLSKTWAGGYMNLLEDGIFIDYDNGSDWHQEVNINTKRAIEYGCFALIDARETSVNEKSVIHVEAKGAQRTPSNSDGILGNCAINMTGGYLRGHCASLKVVSASTTIERGINVVVITGNRDVTITPPTLSETCDDGYLLRVVKDGYGTMRVNGTSYDTTKRIELIWSFNQKKWIRIL